MSVEGLCQWICCVSIEQEMMQAFFLVRKRWWFERTECPFVSFPTRKEETDGKKANLRSHAQMFRWQVSMPFHLTWRLGELCELWKGLPQGVCDGCGIHEERNCLLHQGLPSRGNRLLNCLIFITKSHAFSGVLCHSRTGVRCMCMLKSNVVCISVNAFVEVHFANARFEETCALLSQMHGPSF